MSILLLDQICTRFGRVQFEDKLIDVVGLYLKHPALLRLRPPPRRLRITNHQLAHANLGVTITILVLEPINLAIDTPPTHRLPADTAPISNNDRQLSLARWLTHSRTVTQRIGALF